MSNLRGKINLISLKFDCISMAVWSGLANPICIIPGLWTSAAIISRHSLNLSPLSPHRSRTLSYMGPLSRVMKFTCTRNKIISLTPEACRVTRSVRIYARTYIYAYSDEGLGGRAFIPPTVHMFTLSARRLSVSFKTLRKKWLKVGAMRNVSIVPRIMQFVNIGYAVLIRRG